MNKETRQQFGRCSRISVGRDAGIRMLMMRAFINLANVSKVIFLNAEGVRKFQPRATPWEALKLTNEL
jgi:hypothetical protein